MKPPMIPNAGREVDAVNFRSVKESESVDIGAARVPSRGDTVETPGEKEVDPFEEFNSGMSREVFLSGGWGLTMWTVTLHHDGEHDAGNHHQIASSTPSDGEEHGGGGGGGKSSNKLASSMRSRR
jgi:protein-serine/threonine kinase